MTVTVVDLLAGPFEATGSAQELPFSFLSITPEEVEVYFESEVEGEVVQTVISPSLYTVSLNENLLGVREEGGSVTLSADVVEDGTALYVRAAPKLGQPDVWSNQSSRLDALNASLDRIHMHLLWQRQFGGGGGGEAIVGPPGPPGGLTPEEAENLVLALAGKANVDGSNIDVESWLSILGLGGGGDVDLAPVYAALALKASINSLPSKPVVLNVDMTPSAVREAIQTALNENAGVRATFIPPHPTPNALWPVDQEIKVPDNSILESSGRKGFGLRLCSVSEDGVASLAKWAVVTNSLNDRTNRSTPNRNIIIRNIELDGNIDNRFGTVAATANIAPGTLSAGATFTQTINVSGLVSSTGKVRFNQTLPRGARLRWVATAGVMTVRIDNTTDAPLAIPSGTLSVLTYSGITGLSYGGDEGTALWLAGVHDSVVSNVYAHGAVNHSFAADGGTNTQLTATQIRNGVTNYSNVQTKNLVVENCDFSDSSDDVVTTHNVDGVFFINTVGRDAQQGNRNGFEIDDWSRNVFLANCRSDNTMTNLEIKAHDHSGAAQGVHVVNFLGENAVAQGISLYHAGNSVPIDTGVSLDPSRFARNVSLVGVRIRNAARTAGGFSDYSGLHVSDMVLQAGPQTEVLPWAMNIENCPNSTFKGIFVDGFGTKVDYGVVVGGEYTRMTTLEGVTSRNSGKLGGFYLGAFPESVNMIACNAAAPAGASAGAAGFVVDVAMTLKNHRLAFCRSSGYEQNFRIDSRIYLTDVEVIGGMVYEMGGALTIRRASSGHFFTAVRNNEPVFSLYSDTFNARFRAIGPRELRFGHADDLQGTNEIDLWGIVTDSAGSRGALRPVDGHYDVGGPVGYVGRFWGDGISLRDAAGVPATEAGFSQLYTDTGTLKIRFGDGSTGTITVTPDP